MWGNGPPSLASESRPDPLCDGSNADQEGAIDVAVELEKKDVGAVLEGEALAIEGPELRAADEWLASLVGYVESSRVTVDPLADLVHHYWYSQVLVRCLRNMDYNLLMVVAGPCKSIGRDILECLEGSCCIEVNIRRNACETEKAMSFEQSYLGNPPGIICSGSCAAMAMDRFDVRVELLVSYIRISIFTGVRLQLYISMVAPRQRRFKGGSMSLQRIFMPSHSKG